MEGLILLPAMVALPLAGAFVVALIGTRVRWAGAAITCGVLVALLAGALRSFGTTGDYAVGGWPAEYAIDLHLDGLTALMFLLVAVVSLLAAVYSVGYFDAETRTDRYYTLFLLMVAGMNGVVGAGDLFNLYVFVEIASMAAYALIAFGGRGAQVEASFKYAVLGGIASSLILLGIGILYSVTGTLNMAGLAEGLATARGDLVALATGMLLVGFGFKAALVPFHTWLLDAHPAAPSPISAVLSGVLNKVLGVYVLARLVLGILPPEPTTLGLLRGLGVASMVIGGLAALGQRDAKRLLAYSTVEQVGYLVLAFGLGTWLGAVAAIFHMVNHAAFKALLFFNVGVVERATGTRQLNALGGLAKELPGTCSASVIGALSNAGLPPFGGFWSKLLLTMACVAAGAPELAAVVVGVSVITLAFQLRLQHEVFFGEAPEAPRSLRPVPLAMRLPHVVLAVLCAGLGLLCLTGLTRPLGIERAAKALTTAEVLP